MSMRLGKYVVFLCLIFGLLSHAGGGFATAQGETEHMKLKVLLLPFLSFAPLFIANEEGYFAEQELTIEFITMRSSATAIPSLAQGDLDVSVGMVNIGLLNAIARGARIRIVADKGYLAPTGCTSNALLARRALVEGGEDKLDAGALQSLRQREDMRFDPASYAAAENLQDPNRHLAVSPRRLGWLGG